MTITEKLFQLLLVLLFLLSRNYAFDGAAPQIKCIEKERQALLKFKEEVTDMYSRLASWRAEELEDCCKWQGVLCDNRTSNVVRLDLRGPPGFNGEPLRGQVSESLVQLQYLEYLDLSNNDFSGSIPVFFGSLARLKYLNLSRTAFNGIIPRELANANLSSLHTLDLSLNYFLSTDTIEWLSPLQSLRNLYLQGVDLTNVTDWARAVSSLPLLKVLQLSDCHLPRIAPSSLTHVNFSAPLAVLDVSANNLSSSVYTWLFKFSSSLTDIDLSDNNIVGLIPDNFANMDPLMHLDLSSNYLEGGIPSYIGDFSSLKSLLLTENNLEGYMPDLMKNLSGRASSTLEYLYLESNLISGPLPDIIAKFSSLKELRLSSNKLNGSMPNAYGQLPYLTVLDVAENEIAGPVPDFVLRSSLRELHLAKNQFSGELTQTIGRLRYLEKLDLGSNYLEGEILESHLLNLSRLQVLDLSFNSQLELRLSIDWIPAFQLHILRLAQCKIGPDFPKWLQTQKNITEIDISVAGITGDIPNWFWNQISGLQKLNVSYNQIAGLLPDLSTEVRNLFLVDLSSNNFVGSVPRLPNTITVADLSSNRLSGGISFLCNSSYENLGYLDLSDNRLSGELPDCWAHLRILVYLNLANNNLSGTIPSSMGLLETIQTLQLRNNSFTGELPRSWQVSRRLNFIDLGQNRLSGAIPPWVGSNISQVVVLSLSSNNFSGMIPQEICSLSKIQILDFSGNRISGPIPKCVNNFSAMTREGSPRQSINHWYWYKSIQYQIETNVSYSEKAYLIWKGRESEYKSTLGLVKSIDLSSNNLTGEIPVEITSLVGLIGVNLSRNGLTGVLSPQFGNLLSLNFLDLSRNQLLGEIPSSLSQLSHLGMLDLSFNNLTGRIPKGTVFQNFDASSYVGNPGLCGDPLVEACAGDEPPQNPEFNRHDEKFITTGFYISLGIGFISGFWGVCGTLFLNRTCRHVLFKFINNIHARLYVTTTTRLSRLQRWLQE